MGRVKHVLLKEIVQVWFIILYSVCLLEILNAILSLNYI